MPQRYGPRYRVRVAETPGDLRKAQALRFRRFRAARSAETGADADGFDERALHVLVEEIDGGRLACCFRLLAFADGSQIVSSYSAQFYGLDKLSRYPEPMLEIGRFCVAEDVTDPSVLRLAWGAVAARIEEGGAGIVFGCSSFEGADADAHSDAFALLKDRHLAPRRWLPRVKAPSVFRFARGLRQRTPDLKAALRAMPPLLRSYLAMGGWVSDHAVIDRDLGTLHVFTGLEISAVPEARKRALKTVST